jgi:hypothetical protein
MDPRSANSRFPDTMPICLPEVVEIVAIMRAFRKPAVGTADLRHWFWQQSLHPVDRSMFSLRVANHIECVRLPMGFLVSAFHGPIA